MTAEQLPEATAHQGSRGTVLHVSPHPDDETLAAGAVLYAMSRAGWRVVNLACGLGRGPDTARRDVELQLACKEWGFVDERVTPPVGLSATDDLIEARRALAVEIAQAVDRHDVDVVVSPQPYDGHHGHEAVASAVNDALTAIACDGGQAGGGGGAPRWWMWGFWNDLRRPTLYAPYGAHALAKIDRALSCYEGELARTAYARLPVARGTVGAVLGWERVFGYGTTPDISLPYADVLTEAVWSDDQWRLGSIGVLNPDDPFQPPTDLSITEWLNS